MKIHALIHRISISLVCTPIMVYSVCMAGYFWPFIIANQVIAPQLPYRGEMAPSSDSFWDQVTATPLIYGDFPNQEVGEVWLSLHSRKSGPIATWTEMSGYGRAIFPHFAYSQSAFTTWLSTQIADTIFGGDVYSVITLRNLATIYLAGLFLMLYGIQLGLNRWASTLAGFIYATAPAFSTWTVNYPFFVSGSMGIITLFAIHRLISSPKPWVWVLLAWAIHVEITSAYLQHTIYMFYLYAGYIAYMLIRQYPTWVQRVRKSISPITAIIVGAIASLPMLVDLFVEYQFSIRSLEQTATTNKLPFLDLYRMTALILPEIYNTKPLFTLPISNDLQLLNGRYFSWLMAILIGIGITHAWRHVKGWVLWLGLAFAMTYIPPIHDFSFTFIFPKISAWSKPFDFASLHLPAAIIMLWGLHQIIEQPLNHRWWIGIIGVIILTVTVSASPSENAQPRWLFVFFELGVLAAIISRNIWHTKHYIYIIALVTLLTSAFVTFPTISRQAHADMRAVDIVHQKIKASLNQKQSMVEISTPKTRSCCFVRGNENIVFQIPTVHIYRSNISVYYSNLVRRLGGQIKAARVSNYIQPRFNSTDFWMLNVGVILSYQQLESSSLELLATHNQLNIYRNKVAGAQCCIQIAQKDLDIAIQRNPYGHLTLDIGNIRKHTYTHITKSADQGDIYELANPTGAATIVVINHVFHPKWYAYSVVGGSYIPLETVVINQIYQGIIIPEGTTHISMQFTPWSRWMWLIHWGWITLFCLSILIATVLHIKKAMQYCIAFFITKTHQLPIE